DHVGEACAAETLAEFGPADDAVVGHNLEEGEHAPPGVAAQDVDGGDFHGFLLLALGAEIGGGSIRVETGGARCRLHPVVAGEGRPSTPFPEPGTASRRWSAFVDHSGLATGLAISTPTDLQRS